MRIAVSPTAQMPIHHRVILDAFVACHPAKGFSPHGCGGARPGAKVGNGWLLAQALRSQPESGWQLVRARQRRRSPNQLERTR
jgi:hypothetical protein